MSKTDSEIKKLFKELMKNKKSTEAGKLRTAYILYHTTESEKADTRSDLLREFLVYEKVFIDVAYGVNKEDSGKRMDVDPNELCGINAFLTARSFLTGSSIVSYFGEANIHLAEELLKKEWTALEVPVEQQLNSIWLFNAYIGNQEEILSGKHIELLNGKHPHIETVSDSFENGTYSYFEDNLNSLYKKQKSKILKEDRTDIRISHKGCMTLYYAYNKMHNNPEKALEYLEKALTMTKPEELEYNILRFLRKELRIELNIL